MTGAYRRCGASEGVDGAPGLLDREGRSRPASGSSSLPGLLAIAIGLSACATMGGPPRMLGSVDLSRGVMARSHTLTDQPRWELEVNPGRMLLIVVHNGVHRAERPRLTLMADRGVYEAVTDAGLRIRLTVFAEPCTTEVGTDESQLTARVEVGGSVYDGCAAERLEEIIVAGAAAGLSGHGARQGQSGVRLGGRMTGLIPMASRSV